MLQIRRPAAWTAGILLAAATGWLIYDLRRTISPGWDEASISTYALILADHLKHGEYSEAFAYFQNATNYPPLGWLSHVAAFLVLGDHWYDARVASVLAWAGTIAIASRLSRRLVAAEHGDCAALATTALALGGWLGVDMASVAMLESWTSFTLGFAVFSIVRAHEKGTRGAGLIAGLALGALVLVKYNYAALAFASVIGAESYGLAAALLARRRGAEDAERTLTVAPWIAIGACVVPLWWFVWPLPAGLDMGSQHRRLTLEWLQFSWGIKGFERRDLIYIYPLMACGSVAAFLMQCGGVVRAVVHRASTAHRLCALLAVAGPAAVAVYDHREERFLVPTMVAAWPLAGALVAACAARAHRGPARAAVAAACVASAWLTAGLGAATLVALARPAAPPEFRAALAARVERWTRAPWNAHKRSAGDLRDARLDTCDAAMRSLDLHLPFAWLGGASTEFGRPIVAWIAYDRTRDRALLRTTSQDTEELMHDLGWSEEQFRAWIARYPQVAVVEPPPTPEGGGYDYEWRMMRWMQSNPRFRVRAREAVPGVQGGRSVAVYERLP